MNKFLDEQDDIENEEGVLEDEEDDMSEDEGIDMDNLNASFEEANDDDDDDEEEADLFAPDKSL